MNIVINYRGDLLDLIYIYSFERYILSIYKLAKNTSDLHEKTFKNTIDKTILYDQNMLNILLIEF